METWLGDSALFNFLSKRNLNKPAIGVEVNKSGIAIAHVSYDPEQLPRLLVCESRTINSDQSPGSYQDEITKIYKSITKKIKSNNFVINTTIQQEDRQLLLIEAPQVEVSELNDATRWKIKDMIDFNIDQAVIDVIEIPNLKELKRSPMIYAVIVQRERINSVVDMCSKWGNDLAYIDIPDMVQRNFAALLPEDQNGVAILSLNSNNSLLTITRQGELYLSRELEIGFDDLMNNDQKSDLDSGSDLTLSTESNSISMLQQLERIVLEVQRSLDYYESQYNQPQINSLYLAPLAYDIPEISNYFSTQLGIKTNILDFNILFTTEEPISLQLQSESFYAVGAALR